MVVYKCYNTILLNINRDFYCIVYNLYVDYQNVSLYLQPLKHTRDDLNVKYT